MHAETAISVSSVSSAGTQYALMELAFNQINSDSSFLPEVLFENVWGLYDAEDRKSVFDAITKIAATPGLVAIFGGTTSEASTIIQLVASAGNIPQISATANSPFLSNKVAYPTFMRTSLESTAQVKAGVDFVVEHGWSQVIAIVDENDVHVQDFQQFMKFAQESTLAGRPLDVGLQITVRAGLDPAPAVHQLLNSDLYLVLVFAALPQFVPFYSAAILDGRLGPERNFIYFGGTFVLSLIGNLGSRAEPLLRINGLHPNVTVGRFYDALNGFIGMIGTPGNTTATTEFQEVLRTANRTLYPSVPATFQISHQSVVDGAYTIAHGVRDVVEQGAARGLTACQLFNKSFDGMHLFRSMVNASFVGTSGPVSFDEFGNRIGTLDIVNLISGGNPDGTINVSRVTVTHKWDYGSRHLTQLQPLMWRDGSFSPPSPPPLARRLYPPPPSAPPAPVYMAPRERGSAWIWGVSSVVIVAFVLLLNGFWIVRHFRHKHKAWVADVRAILWGPPKALDCGTVICDAVYKGSDVTVRCMPLNQSLLASFATSARSPRGGPGGATGGGKGVWGSVCAERGPCVRVRSSFHVFANEVIRAHAAKPFFNGEDVHVHLCMEDGGAGAGAPLGGSHGIGSGGEGGMMTGEVAGSLLRQASLGFRPDCPHSVSPGALRTVSSFQVTESAVQPLPRDVKNALVSGTQALIQDAMERHHPNIERVIGGGVAKESVYILLERLTGGSLHAAIQNKTLELEASVLVSLLLDMAAAMKYLHSLRPPVVHGDLNPKSLFLDDHMSLKMSSVSPFYLLNKALGEGTVPFTLEYAAPEVLAGKKPTPASDAYSFGIAIWECFARTDVYMDMTPEAIVKGVLDGTVHPKPVASMPRELQCLMYDCLSPWPQRRPTSAEIHALLLSIYEAKGGLQRFSRLQSKLTAQEALIDKIMPPHVAAALRRGERVPPERHDCVTIMFSDIVGFTEHSAKMLPIEVMQMLDRLYTQFDTLTVKHGLFKVETIGDAYMVVGNLHPKAEDHTARIVRFALDAIAVANTVPVKLDDPSMGTIHVRTGVHTGPVVASVVGTLNPRYCLFGDTVNMTNRIETSSQPDCVHLSKAAAMALHAQDRSMRVVCRGAVMLKGKGEVTTYWLESCLGNLPEASRMELEWQMNASRGLSLNFSMDLGDGHDHGIPGGEEEVQWHKSQSASRRTTGSPSAKGDGGQPAANDVTVVTVLQPTPPVLQGMTA
eukprot:jgi/Mesvir1/7533/Mv19281-RA.2